MVSEGTINELGEQLMNNAKMSKACCSSFQTQFERGQDHKKRNNISFGTT